jgi:hypothetical protein
MDKPPDQMGKACPQHNPVSQEILYMYAIASRNDALMAKRMLATHYFSIVDCCRLASSSILIYPHRPCAPDLQTHSPGPQLRKYGNDVDQAACTRDHL